MSERPSFVLDGVDVPFEPGQTVLQAALAADRYIPHLCYHPEFRPHGSCKLCTAKVDGRMMAACTTPATPSAEVESETAELNGLRRTLVQMLFAEGNHFCPGCESSGNCVLQALGYDLGVMTAGFRHLYPVRPVDASHPDVLLDFNRCVLCELCVRASAEVDGKHVFAVALHAVGHPRQVERGEQGQGRAALGGDGHRHQRAVVEQLFAVHRHHQRQGVGDHQLVFERGGNDAPLLFRGDAVLLLGAWRASCVLAPFTQEFPHHAAAQAGLIDDAGRQRQRQRALAGALGTDDGDYLAGHRTARLAHARQPASASTVNRA